MPLLSFFGCPTLSVRRRALSARYREGWVFRFYRARSDLSARCRPRGRHAISPLAFRRGGGADELPPSSLKLRSAFAFLECGGPLRGLRRSRSSTPLCCIRRIRRGGACPARATQGVACPERRRLCPMLSSRGRMRPASDEPACRRQGICFYVCRSSPCPPAPSSANPPTPKPAPPETVVPRPRQNVRVLFSLHYNH